MENITLEGARELGQEEKDALWRAIAQAMGAQGPGGSAGTSRRYASMSNDIICLVTVNCENLNETVFAKVTGQYIKEGDKVEITIPGKGREMGAAKGSMLCTENSDVYHWISSAFYIHPVTRLWSEVKLETEESP